MHFIEGIPDTDDHLYGDKETANIQNFISNGIKNTIWIFGVFSIPLFFDLLRTLLRSLYMGS